MQWTLPVTVDLETVPDGTSLMTGTGTTLTLWDLADQRKPTVLRRVRKVVGFIWAVQFSPDGKTLATATERKVVRLWDVATGQERAPLRRHADIIQGLAYSPDGRMLASASM